MKLNFKDKFDDNDGFVVSGKIMMQAYGKDN